MDNFSSPLFCSSIIVIILSSFVFLYFNFSKKNLFKIIFIIREKRETRAENVINSFLSKVDLEYIQKAVYFNVTKTGSYFPPSHSCLKLGSLLGLIHYHFHSLSFSSFFSFSSSSDSPELLSFLVNTFFLVVCLCNQYCIKINRLDINDIQEGFWKTDYLSRMTIAYGFMNDVIQIYEYGLQHSPAPKQTLQSLIGSFYTNFILFVEEKQMSKRIFQEISTTVRFWEKAKVNSYLSSDYDPTTSLSIKSFKHVMSNTHCLFAASSRIWGSRNYDNQKTLEENVVSNLSSFAKFLRVSKYEHLDGFVFSLPGNFGNTIQQLSDTVRSVLTCFAQNDPTRPHTNCMHDNLLSPKWQFKFCGESTFVTSFGPCYPSSHSRFAFGSPNVFILFQPEISFGYHEIPPHTEKNKNNVREKIQRNFLFHNRPYSRPSEKYYPVAPLYVKHLDDSKINYWWHNN